MSKDLKNKIGKILNIVLIVLLVALIAIYYMFKVNIAYIIIAGALLVLNIVALFIRTKSSQK